MMNMDDDIDVNDLRLADYPRQKRVPLAQLTKVKDLTLHDAVQSGSYANVDELLTANPASANQAGQNGLTPLHRACYRANLDIIDLLLKHGANVNARDDAGETTMHHVAKRGNPRHFLRLFQNGGDVRCVDSRGNTMLHHAVEGGSILMVQYLIKVYGFQTTDTNNKGENGLHVAGRKHRNEVTNYLLRLAPKQALEVDNRGRLPLHLAAAMGNPYVCCQLLAAHPAGLDRKDEDGKIPVEHVVECSHARCRQYLSNYASPFVHPNVTYYLCMLMPTLLFASFATLSELFPDHCFVILFPMAAYLTFWLSQQSHRVPHPSNAPNPAFMGTFVGGIVLSSYSALVHFGDPANLPYLYFHVTLVGLALGLMVLARPDRQLTSVDDGTIADVASGKFESNQFCSHCEMVQLNNVKHCTLCNACVIDLEHHCLFLMRCVTAQTLWTFSVFIAVVASAQLHFVILSVQLFDRRFSNGDFLKSLFYALYHMPGLAALTLYNLGSLLWSVFLLYNQLRMVSYGLAFFVRVKYQERIYISGKRRILNVLSFLLRRRVVDNKTVIY